MTFRTLARAARSLALAVAAAAAGPAAMAQDFAGILQPLHDITLSSGVGGVVMTRNVQPGSWVAANQVLMVLDDRLQAVEVDRRRVIAQDDSELRATQERLRIARSLYSDAKQVFERTGSISRDELMRLEADFLGTQGRLEQLKAQKEREKLDHAGAQQERQMRQLVAPVAGIVTKVDLEVGEWAKPGEPLVRLVDATTLVFKGHLPLRAVAGLKVGASLPLVVEHGSRAAGVNARVRFVSPVADPASGLVEVHALVANPGGQLRPGSKALLKLGTAAAGDAPRAAPKP